MEWKRKKFPLVDACGKDASHAKREVISSHFRHIALQDEKSKSPHERRRSEIKARSKRSEGVEIREST